MTPLRFSIVIPTYQRRDLVVAAVRALADQQYDHSFEVIVVVDGSEDESANALKQVEVPFPLTVLEQANRGRATACNEGAALARGEILLFLDDDMEAHPRLLAEHDSSHRKGADAVFGHLPLHPESPTNFLSAGIKWWTDGRLQRLLAPGASLTLHDLICGQMSLSRELFLCVGGFDTNFTAGGTFGNEDIDLCYRLTQAGYKLVFNPDAISWQKYVVQPRQNLRQRRQGGHADVAFARKHPEQAKAIFTLNESAKRNNRLLWRPLVALSPFTTPIMTILRWLVLASVDRWPQKPIVAKIFWEVWAIEYWRGVWEAGGMPRPRPVRVLAYHAIKDLAKAPVLEPYGMPPDVFRRQLDTLLRVGFKFISGDEFLCFLRDGGGLPPLPILLTFDDGYGELVDVVLPLLKERGIPAVVFAVSGKLGGTNDWDKVIGAPELRLIDIDGLQRLVKGRVEIGAHSRTHRCLTDLFDEDLVEEVSGSLEDLKTAGLGCPRMFAYPGGDYDERVQRVVKEAGIQAAFTVDAGLVRVGHDAYRIPRVEIMRGDTGWKFLWKVLRCGRSMNPSGLLRLLFDYVSKCSGAIQHCNSIRRSEKELLDKCSEDYTRQINWWLRVGEGNLADLQLASNGPDTVRVAIIRAETKPEFDIQLNRDRLKARLNHHYVINFQARADRSRSIFLGFAKAHEPWDGLGLYKKIELTTQWQTFEEDFVATANDTNARIHFDVGGSDIPVEFSSVSISSSQDVASIGQHSSPIRPGKLEPRKVLSGQPPEGQELTLVPEVAPNGSQGRCRGLILTYHHIVEVPSDPWSLCVTPQHFAEHLEILKKWTQLLQVRQLSQSLQNEQITDLAAVVTFDDGYADNLYHAKPLLERYDIPATVFLTTGFIGDKREFWWDELDRLLLQPGRLPGVLRLSINDTTQQWELGEAAYYSEELWQRDRYWSVSENPPSSRHSLYVLLWRLLQRLREEERQSVLGELRAWAHVKPWCRASHRALSLEEVYELAQGGLVEIGSHTMTHSVLSSLPVSAQREEIRLSKSSLEQLVGRTVTSFAYPYGSEHDYTADTVTLVREAGFNCACSTRGTVVTKNSDPFQLPRVQVQDWNGDEFAHRLSQWFDD